MATLPPPRTATRVLWAPRVVVREEVRLHEIDAGEVLVGRDDVAQVLTGRPRKTGSPAPVASTPRRIPARTARGARRACRSPRLTSNLTRGVGDTRSRPRQRSLGRRNSGMPYARTRRACAVPRRRSRRGQQHEISGQGETGRAAADDGDAAPRSRRPLGIVTESVPRSKSATKRSSAPIATAPPSCAARRAPRTAGPAADAAADRRQRVALLDRTRRADEVAPLHLAMKAGMSTFTAAVDATSLLCTRDNRCASATASSWSNPYVTSGKVRARSTASCSGILCRDSRIGFAGDSSESALNVAARRQNELRRACRTRRRTPGAGARRRHGSAAAHRRSEASQCGQRRRPGPRPSQQVSVASRRPPSADGARTGRRARPRSGRSGAVLTSRAAESRTVSASRQWGPVRR